VLETNLTQTYFYSAQVYQQSGDVERGIQYCCLTIQRQIQSQQYDFKDFARNCMSLAEYFTNQGQYAQAEYLLYAALKLVPAGNEHEELRCMVQTSIGHYYQHLLAHLVRLF
jgi:hypothetical protein